MTNFSTLDCPHPSSECFRTLCLTILFMVTGLACLVQTVRIVRNTRRFLNYQLLVLYLAIVECLLAVLHWGFAPGTYFIQIIIYLKQLELCVITFFFIYSALSQNGFRLNPNKVLFPVFAVIFLAFTVVLLVGISGIMIPAHMTCADPSFLMMSAMGLLLSTVFLTTGVIVTRRYNELKLSTNLKRQRKMVLYALILVYFLTAVTSTTWDLIDTIQFLSVGACDQVDSVESSWTLALFKLCERCFDLLVPLWAFILVFEVEARRDTPNYTHEPFSVSEPVQAPYASFFPSFSPTGISFGPASGSEESGSDSEYLKD